MDRLLERYHKLLRETGTDFQRYLYADIRWDAQMTGISGPRGVGKTTLVLQHIKLDLNVDETLYVTVDDFYFSENTLLDLADKFEKRGGKTLFIDEIHKYGEWSRELKLIYDYHPQLKVVFTGSSVLDINRGVADLSRRAVMYRMQGLSFREYLAMFHGVAGRSYTLQEVLAHRVEISGPEHPLPLFDEYLRQGYYPFAKKGDYSLILQQIINQTLEVDIPQYAEMNVSTGRRLKRLMALIARSVPFKPNFSQIAAALGASRNNIADYCLYIEDAGLIAQLRDSAGGSRGLGKVDRVYLDNTNLLYSLAARDAAEIGNVRETFFFNQTRVKYDVLASPVSDFEIDGMTFEVGGRSKEQKQIQGVDKGFVVKDAVETGYANVIPLWHFGMIY
jgi:predicted AAA+ superfamily ATPase